MERKYGQLPNRVEFMQDVRIETADVDIVLHVIQYELWFTFESF